MPDKSRSSRWLLTAWLALALAMSANASFIYVIGPDQNFVPNQLYLCSADCSNSLGLLGDGVTYGFNGGLAQNGFGLNLYAIANDPSGASSLFTMSLSGMNSLVGAPGSLGSGFTGGLAYDGANFFALASDGTGSFGVYQVNVVTGTASPLGVTVGTGFHGFTFNLLDGMFYGIASDDTGESFLYRWHLSGGTLTNFTQVAGLGPGFGGLSYDIGRNSLWTIGNVSNAVSVLSEYSLTGAPLSSTALGDGYSEVAAVLPAIEGHESPEPATAVLTVAALAVLGCSKIRGNAVTQKERQ